jgi:hypothetical protein
LGVFFDPDGRVKSVALQTTSYDMGTPLTAMRVTGSTATALSLTRGFGAPERFEDKMETSY